MTGDSAVVVRAQASATEFIRSQTIARFGESPMDAIYLDCVLVGNTANGGWFSAIPRNELPYLSGPEMQPYVVARSFEIARFYIATNAPRQEAGRVKTTILKFVRKK